MRNVLFVCALTLLVNSSSRAQEQQQPQPKPDSKSTPPDPTAQPQSKFLDPEISRFDNSAPQSEKKVTTMLWAAAAPPPSPPQSFLPPTAQNSSALIRHLRLVLQGSQRRLRPHHYRRRLKPNYVHQQLKETHYRLDSSRDEIPTRPNLLLAESKFSCNPLASEPLEFEVVSAEESQNHNQSSRRNPYNRSIPISSSKSPDLHRPPPLVRRLGRLRRTPSLNIPITPNSTTNAAPSTPKSPQPSPYPNPTSPAPLQIPKMTVTQHHPPRYAPQRKTYS